MVVTYIDDLHHRSMSALRRHEWQQRLVVQRMSFECHEPKKTVTRPVVGQVRKCDALRQFQTSKTRKLNANAVNI